MITGLAHPQLFLNVLHKYVLTWPNWNFSVAAAVVVNCLYFIPQTPSRSWRDRRRITLTSPSRSRTAAWPIRLPALCGSSLPTLVFSWWVLSSTLKRSCSDSSRPFSLSSTITSSTQASVTYHQATQSAWGHPAAMSGRSGGHPVSWPIRLSARGSPGSCFFRRCTSASRSSIPLTTYRWAASADGPCSKCSTVLTARYKCPPLKWVDRSELMNVSSGITDPKVISFTGLNPVKALHGLLPQRDAGLLGEHGWDWHPLEGVC